MATINAAQEDWNVLVSFFPPNWKQLAQLRNDKTLIVQAAAQAQKAADFILGLAESEAVHD
jgi:antirestriction protein ArdC